MLSTTMPAGGQGRSAISIEIPSTEFGAIVQLMFAANRDRALRAFAKALTKTAPIAPVLPAED